MQEKLQKVYNLYSNREFYEAKALNDQILAETENNVYAQKYQKIIEAQILKEENKGNKAKNIKAEFESKICPHCAKKLRLSDFSLEIQEKFKSQKFDQFLVKCVYCNNQFDFIGKVKLKTKFDLYLGKEISYKEINYKVVGAVKYQGTYYESGDSGYLNYVEWFLIDEKNNYLYFSESNYGEFEFSRKITPNFNFEINKSKSFWTNSFGSVIINGRNYSVHEKSVVKVIKSIGENSKSYTIGEKVTLNSFRFGGRNYVYEEESAGSQKEIGIYDTWKTNYFESSKIFGGGGHDFSFGNFGGIEKIKNFFIITLFGGAFSNALFGWQFTLFIFTLIFGFIVFKVLSKGDENISKTQKILIVGIIFVAIGPLLAFFIIPQTRNIIDLKQNPIVKNSVNLSEINEIGNYKIAYETTEEKKTFATGIRNYDYGGVKTNYEERNYFNFSIQDENDLEIVKRIHSEMGNHSILRDLFEGKLYKITREND